MGKRFCPVNSESVGEGQSVLVGFSERVETESVLRMETLRRECRDESFLVESKDCVLDVICSCFVHFTLLHFSQDNIAHGRELFGGSILHPRFLAVRSERLACLGRIHIGWGYEIDRCAKGTSLASIIELLVRQNEPSSKRSSAADAADCELYFTISRGGSEIVAKHRVNLE